MFVLADDELFEFCVSCVKFGENRRVFVEFVGSVIFVDLKLSQNPLLPTTFSIWTWVLVQEGFVAQYCVFLGCLYLYINSNCGFQYSYIFC